MKNSKRYTSIFAHIGSSFVGYIKWLAAPNLDRRGEFDGEEVFLKALLSVLLLVAAFLFLVFTIGTEGVALGVVLALIALVDFLRYLGHLLNQVDTSDE